MQNKITYVVATCRIPNIQKKFNWFAKKAEKIGQSIKLNILKDEVRVLVPECINYLPSGKEYFVPAKLGFFTHFEVEGFEAVINGYRFLGVINHHDSGNIFRAVEGFNIPEKFRHNTRWCDHCKKNRRRNDTYIVEEVATGEYLQVGKNCLRDFLGGNDPQAYAAYFEVIADYEAESLTLPEPEEVERGGWGEVKYATEDVINLAACAAKQFGFVSRKQAQDFGKIATSERVYDNLFRGQCLRESERIQGDKEAVEEGEQALKWIRDLNPNYIRDEYISNLYYCLNLENLSRREIGLAVSVIGAYKAEIERINRLQALELAKAKEAGRKAPAGHVGIEGQKKVELHLSLTAVYPLESDYGITYLHKFVDKDGNVVLWFTSSVKLESGKFFKVNTTIKEHRTNTKTNLPETIVLRTKVLETADEWTE